MEAGFSEEFLADWPLDSWAEFYKIVKSREMDRNASLVSVAHSSDPNKLRNYWLAQAKRLRFGADETNEMFDPKKFARKLRAMGVQGLQVREAKG